MVNYVFKKKYLKVLMGAVELFGYLVIAPIIFIRGLFLKKEQPRAIVVLRLDQIGDMIQALPFFDALKKKYPQSVVHAVCVKDCAFLLENNKNIDFVHIMSSSWFYPERKTNLLCTFSKSLESEVRTR